MPPTPRIEVLGVYRLNVTPEFFRESFTYGYGDGSNDDPVEYERLRTNYRNLLNDVALVECRVTDRDEHFSFDDFSQSLPHVSPDQRQAAYLEKCLSLDGSDFAPGSTRYICQTVPEGDLRVAFFMHSWDPSLSLETSYGPIPCPAPAPVPERLNRLIQYDPVD